MKELQKSPFELDFDQVPLQPVFARILRPQSHPKVYGIGPKAIVNPEALSPKFSDLKRIGPGDYQLGKSRAPVIPLSAQEDCSCDFSAPTRDGFCRCRKCGFSRPSHELLPIPTSTGRRIKKSA